MPGKILITGGTGYVGGWVTEALLHEGYEVTHLGRRSYPNHQVTSIIADIADRDAVQQALAHQTFDTVIHLAAADQRQHEDVLEQVNFMGMQNLLSALYSHPPSTFIYLSSIKVYGQVSGDITESTPPNALAGAYGRTKLNAENWLLKASNSRNVVLRLSNAYGAPKSKEVEAWHLLFNDLCRSAYEKGEITLKSPPDTLLDMIWLGSVSHVILESIRNDSLHGVYNLGAGKSIAIGEVAAAVSAAYMGYFGKELVINMPEPAGSLPSFMLDSQRLQSVIPYDTQSHFEAEALEIFKLLAQN